MNPLPRVILDSILTSEASELWMLDALADAVLKAFKFPDTDHPCEFR